jgi:uncharacterized damage-inducible protein DinB
MSDFPRLFAYDAWANRAMVAGLGAAGEVPPRPLAVMAHIIGAEWVWWSRLTRERVRHPVWPTLTLEQCADEAVELGEVWSHLVGELPPGSLSDGVKYTNSQGEHYESTVGDILLHVTLHSAYHRGQIASAIRAAGHAPPSTDFIHAVRQGFVPARES